MTIADETCSAKELGAVLNLTARRVRQLHEEGVFPRAERGQYPLAACVQAYIATITAANDPEDVRRERTLLIKTQRRRLEQLIRDSEAAGEDLDWQDAMIQALAIECQFRIQMIAAWLFREFEHRDVQMHGQLNKGDAMRAIAGKVEDWAIGIRTQMEADFLAIAARARKKRIRIDSWQKLIELHGKTEVSDDGAGDVA